MENHETTEHLQNGKKESPEAVAYEKEYLTEDIQKAASWFFWIAGFSLVNSLIYTFSGGIYLL